MEKPKLPQKPELEKRTRKGRYGEIVEELTPQSEILWSDYLRALNIAQRAMYLAQEK